MGRGMEMYLKKLLSVIVSLAAVLCMSAAVSAVDMNIVYEAGGYSKSDIELMEKMRVMIENHDNSTLDLSKYNVSYSQLEDLYGTVVFNNPKFYYVSMVSARLEYKTKNKVLKFTPIYTHSSAYASVMKKDIDKVTETIMAGVDSNMSDADKVLYIHDTIVGMCDYYEGEASNTGRSIYSTLVERSSVCVGYSLTFQYFMDLLDIPCICITNDDHIWNMVQINENWYHVDTTWDDMNAESPNLVLHDMVLLSEYGLDRSDIRHAQWRYGMTADSSKYDDMFWSESYSKMNYCSGYWYYNTMDGLCRYSFKTGREEVVSHQSSRWLHGS
ncbi:MAG: hypothetical protein IJ080_04710, partial [Oscillospiraceae bacterium]|nr:hypothetical protein [Oscillospiraceae bacterium]